MAVPQRNQHEVTAKTPRIRKQPLHEWHIHGDAHHGYAIPRNPEYPGKNLSSLRSSGTAIRGTTPPCAPSTRRLPSWMWSMWISTSSTGRSRSTTRSEHLQRLFDETSVVPTVNVLELNPILPQARLRTFHAQHGITTWAWNVLGQGRGLLDASVLRQLAHKHGRSAAQVLLRWHVQQGNLVASGTSSSPSSP